MDSIAHGKTVRGDPARPLVAPPDVAVDAVAPPDVAGPLLERVAAGDEAAFASLYDEVAPLVYGLCLRMFDDPAQAEAVAQDVLVEVWRSAEGFDPARESARTWVATLTHRLVVDRMLLTTVPNDVPWFDQVTEAAIADAGHRQVRRCLRALTRAQRRAIILAYFGGRTYQQVAKQLALPIPAVKTLIRDGMIRLRDSIEAGPRTKGNRPAP